MWVTCRPVSYTHLDVYKRQIGNLAAQLLHKRRVLIFGVYDIESGLSILES